MAMETVTVRMSRSDSAVSWGFRLQGGKEFGTSLIIGKVAEGSLADRAGLREGDYLLQVGGKNAEPLRHKEAQDTIISCGNNLDLVVQRVSTEIWRPSIIPVEFPPSEQRSEVTTGGSYQPSMITQTTTSYQPPVKVSLQHDKQESHSIGSGFNVAPKPFIPAAQQQQQQQQYVSRSPVPASQTTTVSHLQYNSPSALYSPKEAAKAYLDQTGGLFGTDPSLAKKEQPKFMQSATLRLIQEEEKSHQHRHTEQQQQPYSETLRESEPAVQSDSFRRLDRALHHEALAQHEPSLESRLTETHISTTVTGHVEAPREVPQAAPIGGTPLCDGCGRPIIGVFCKAGGKTLHADCFNCSTCGASLKNTGFFTVNDKLYCEVHARQHQSMFKPQPPVDPNAFHSRAPPVLPPVKPTEPPHASYQTNVLVPGPISPHPTGASQMSPASRGIPTANRGGSTYQRTVTTTTQQFSSAPQNGVAPVAPPQSAPFVPPSGDLPDSSSFARTEAPPVDKFTFPSHLPSPKQKLSGPVAITNPNSIVFGPTRRNFVWPPGGDLTAPQYWQSAKSPNSAKFGSDAKMADDLNIYTSFRLRSNRSESDTPERQNFTPNPNEKAVELPYPSIYANEVRDEHVLIPGRKVTTVQITEEHHSFVDPIQFTYDNWAKQTDQSANEIIPIDRQSIVNNIQSDVNQTTIMTTADSHLRTNEIDIDAEIEEQTEIQTEVAQPVTNEFQSRPDSLGIEAPFSDELSSGSAPLPTAPAGGNSVGSRAPRRGRGVLKTGQEGGLHGRIPVCECCQREIRGAYILAMGKSWAPDHFTCANPQCHRKLQELGFVEENNQLYCEYCFEQYFAPTCSKCNKPVTGDCLNALERQWHPDCFVCCHCHKPFGNSSFFLEDGKAYCEVDWNGLFTTKCLGCQFPIEAGDRWVEALGNSYHSDCFTCTMCHKNLEGQSFYAKGGKPYCKAHA